jgi:PRTRC genetic system protein C
VTEVQVKTRVFKYGDQVWDGPGPEFSVEDVKRQLTTFYPELANADVKQRDLDDGRVEVKFVKRAGTKGPPSLGPVLGAYRTKCRRTKG